MTLEEAGGSLLEVAVALPVQGTFTYRDPRPGAAAPIGAQVVVPFGSRTVTGFVVARGAPAAAGAPAARDIEEVVAGEPAFDEAMIGFCRWVADYYQAPLGEVLRAALPQGEQASATRAVRLTAAGRQALERQPRAAPGRGARGPGAGARWRRRAASWRCGGSSGSCRAPRRQLPRLVEAGLVEVGDEVQNRRPPPTVAYARATGRVRGQRCRSAPPRKRIAGGQARGGGRRAARRRRCPRPSGRRCARWSRPGWRASSTGRWRARRRRARPRRAGRDDADAGAGARGRRR